jgi:hypothetical protein
LLVDVSAVTAERRGPLIKVGAQYRFRLLTDRLEQALAFWRSFHFVSLATIAPEIAPNCFFSNNSATMLPKCPGRGRCSE